LVRLRIVSRCAVNCCIEPCSCGDLNRVTSTEKSF
jgi:hypothetical protein